jgi:hypothetical protein
MGHPQVGVETGRCKWWERFTARLRPTPTRPPSYHASRTVNTHPGQRGRHRGTPGAQAVTYPHPNGHYITFRRRP